MWRACTQQDVSAVDALTDYSFLTNFKNVLLSSPDAIDLEHHADDIQLVDQYREELTYPAVVLNGFPDLPSTEELASSRSFFQQTFIHLPFCKKLPFPSPTVIPIVPHLQLAIACLAYTMRMPDENCLNPKTIARDLFMASFKLWTVVMEVDNRETRAIDSVMTILLLCLYGIMTFDSQVHERCELLLCSGSTIIRRLQMLDTNSFDETSNAHIPCKSSVYSGNLASQFLILDVMFGIHIDAPSNFQTKDFRVKLPTAPVRFQAAYQALFSRNESETLGASSVEDAITLLVGVLSDAACIRRALQLNENMEGESSAYRARSLKSMPFVPLSPTMELRRMFTRLGAALTRWHTAFSGLSDPSTFALYHYCELYLVTPYADILPHAAGYRPGSGDVSQNEPFAPPSAVAISDESISHAWRVLEYASAAATLSEQQRQLSSSGTLPVAGYCCSVFMPLILFRAALVVWARLAVKIGSATSDYTGFANASMSGFGSKNNTVGSLKSLLAFKVELEKMAWPCAQVMASTLDRLMA